MYNSPGTLVVTHPLAQTHPSSTAGSDLTPISTSEVLTPTTRDLRRNLLHHDNETVTDSCLSPKTLC